MPMPEHYTDEERSAFRAGVDAERNGFRCNPHSDLYQDVLKIETAEFKLHLTYDDVDAGYEMAVTFKGRLRNDEIVSRRIHLDSYAAAMARAARFMATHAPPRAVCHVDY